MRTSASAAFRLRATVFAREQSRALPVPIEQPEHGHRHQQVLDIGPEARITQDLGEHNGRQDRLSLLERDPGGLDIEPAVPER